MYFEQSSKRSNKSTAGVQQLLAGRSGWHVGALVILLGGFVLWSISSSSLLINRSTLDNNHHHHLPTTLRERMVTALYSLAKIKTTTAATTLPTPSCLPILPNASAIERYTPSRTTELSHCLDFFPLSSYLNLFRHTLAGLPRAGTCVPERGCAPPHGPFVEESRENGRDWPPYSYTMTGHRRLEQMRAAVLEVELNQIPGSIVELGVWRGGMMMYVAATLQELRQQLLSQFPDDPLPPKRNLYLYDAYGRVGGGKYGIAADYLAVPLEEVTAGFDFFGLREPVERDPAMDPAIYSPVNFVKGLFSDTVPKWESDETIAVLRLDGNFYESHQMPFYHLYERVPIGGIIVLDDIGSHAPVKRFWKDFQEDQGFTEELTHIDWTGGWYRKTKHVKVDWSKYHTDRIKFF
jgi:Macrocin-O-methyltransferase (TylF)